MTLGEIHAQYDTYVRHIHINRDVDQYKVYLVVMWLVVEFIGIKIGLNIGGYTISQMKAMNRYQRLLIELGEINYKSSAEAAAKNNWSVEVRILFLALINAVAFILINMLAKFIGEGTAKMIGDCISGFFAGETPQPGSLLFGGPEQQADSSPLQGIANQLGGVDLSSIIANLGTAFLSAQAKPSGQQQPAAKPQQQKFAPAYSE